MRDLNKLAEAGERKLQEHPKRQLVATEIIELIESSSLKGSDELFYLISKVYSLGFEEGYRAHQSKEQIKRRLTA